jgi:hypothetical protein
MSGLELDKKAFEELRLQYDAARVAGKESFVFQGHEILVTYAKYMIEMLEGRFK